MTTQCCKCRKVVSDGRWKEPPVVLAGQVSHTYCPVCLEKALREIRAEFKAAAATAV